MRRSIYRCSLPGLAGFIDSHCAGPGLQRRGRQPDAERIAPRTGIPPRYSGLRVQGTANSPPSTAKFLRREWDSNPRGDFSPTRSPGVPDQPLPHLSMYELLWFVTARLPRPVAAVCPRGTGCGEGGIRTHEEPAGPYPLSRRAPSTAQAPLHVIPHVPVPHRMVLLHTSGQFLCTLRRLWIVPPYLKKVP